MAGGFFRSPDSAGPAFAVLGTGKVLTPENALIVTNRVTGALTVPLPGVDKVVPGSDIGSGQWMWAL